MPSGGVKLAVASVDVPGQLVQRLKRCRDLRKTGVAMARGHRQGSCAQSRFLRVGRGLSAFLGLGLVLVGLTWYMATSGAVTIATNSNGANRVQSGTVAITDDDAGTVMFNTFGGVNDGYLSAGRTLTPRCVKVDYSGSWAGEVLRESFTTLDPGLWSSSDASLSGGQLVVNTPVGPDPWGFIGHSFTEASTYAAQVEVTSLATTTWLTLDMQNETFLGMFAEAGQLHFREARQGFADNDTAVAWDAAAMRFWRIVRSGQAVRWQYSADGRIWVTGREIVTTIGHGDATLSLLAGSGGSATFDNVLLTPATGIRLYGNPTGDLGPYLNVKVESGTGGASGNCAGFTPTGAIFEGPLSSFPTDYLHGVGEWFPAGSSDTQTYRFTISTMNTNAIHGKTASSTFTWEVQAGS